MTTMASAPVFLTWCGVGSRAWDCRDQGISVIQAGTSATSQAGLNSSSSGPLSPISRDMSFPPRVHLDPSQSLTLPQAWQWCRLTVSEKSQPQFMHIMACVTGTRVGSLSPRLIPSLSRICSGQQPVRREPEGQLGRCSPFLPNSESSLLCPLVCLPDCKACSWVELWCHALTGAW